MRRFLLLLTFGLLVLGVWAQQPPASDWAPRLLLEINDAETRTLTAARFSLLVNGEEHEPSWIGPHGLRFVSVHVSKRQTATFYYSRGTGTVEVPLKPGARRVEIRAVKGFDYLPVIRSVDVESGPVRVSIEMRRWNRLREDGWRSADAHLHYDRVDAAGDRDWFHMLAGDDLSLAQWMVLKGGMVPGVWARQYAYGKQGEHVESGRTLVPGEEFRDRLQGHILLFGLDEVIQPIMTGIREAPNNEPAFFDVLTRAQSGGGLVGPAHGATLGTSTTGLADALNGAVDFWEIGNSHLWDLDAWYTLMNLGVIVPPMAGTDLPNNPGRDSWQPFLGGMRTYVRTEGEPGSDVWNQAVRDGRVFVSNGPMIRLTVNGEGPGGAVRLPAGGGEVEIEAEIASPRAANLLEIIRNGEVTASSAQARQGDGVQRIRITRKLAVTESSWIAARGEGAVIESIDPDERAHTAAVRVLVGDEPIFSPETAAQVRTRLQEQKSFYESNGKYGSAEGRRRMSDLFDRAIAKITR